MNFWKSLFGKSTTFNTDEADTTKISDQFQDWVKYSIQLFGIEGKNMSNHELAEHLEKHGVPQFDAHEIIVFLPFVMTKLLLPNVNWCSEYIDFYSERKQYKIRYDSNKRYQIIEKESKNHMTESPNNDLLLNIALRNSEFIRLNKILEDGGNMEEIVMTETCIMRFN